MKHWESALVGPQTALEEAITVLDRSALRIVLVVDGERRLLGTLTDGDIRRGLLKHLPLDTPSAEVMCATPTTALRTWSKEKMLAVMEQRQLLHLPIVDEANHVVGLETMQGILSNQRRDNPVFLMAGGFGSRLMPLTKEMPKPLLRIGNKPILEIILESVIKCGFHRFYISTHYMPGMIREHFDDGSRWGVDIRYVHEAEPLGTGGALGLLPRDEIALPMLMMNGDVLTTLDYGSLLDFHVARGGIATMCVSEYGHQVPFGVIHADEGHIVSMVEKPVHKWFVNAGIYLLSPDFIKTVEPGKRVDMPTLLQLQIDAGRKVNMFPVHEQWLDVGRMGDLERAQAGNASQGSG